MGGNNGERNIATRYTIFCYSVRDIGGADLSSKREEHRPKLIYL